ncbi:MAG TPA: tetratricopeptide repeat protein [Geothrix sp.]|nr:tetratricopeptide repeat protein [Geothrix sp.]
MTPADPETLQGLFDRGERCVAGEDFPGAVACYDRALELAPGLPEVHANLGVARERMGAPAEAEACYRRALALDPDFQEGILNLGALLVQQKRFAEAEAIYVAAMRKHSESPALWSSLGVLHACLKQEAEAERCLREALRLDPGHHRARYNLSYILLRQMRFEEGWEALEARAWSLALNDQIPAPRWQGESLVGKSLLVGSEAGFGDMIHFVRYLPLLKQRGAVRLGLVCPAPLQRLFASLRGVDAVVALGEPVPDLGWDLWTLPMSAPHHCGTRPDSIPASVPYLQADPEQVKVWAERMPDPGLKVGLAWKGNPRFENDADRSLPGLEVLAPLAASGLQFVSLQKGVAEEEARVPPPGLAVFDPSPWIGDFADTAALMMNLDLVITVDTAAAHLAGALGRPCWVLLPHHKTDWRWFTGREDSPWYPGLMRLFRQGPGGGWEAVISEVAEALRALARTPEEG